MSTRRRSLDSVGINIGQVPSVNTGLWLDKYILDLTKSDANNFSNFLRDVSLHSTSTAYGPFFKRWTEMLGEFKATARKATVKGRMIVGLGDESTLETSIALHHTYGVPYIPGSALKGLASSYAHQKLSENWQKESVAHNIIFGNTDTAGYITFFDALYVPDSGHRGQALYPDIITVHHQDYYNTGKNTAPADWDSPTPVPFLSATGSYLIALAAPDLPTNNEWVQSAFNILEAALKEMGIGAKTSSGYGRMEFEIDQNGPGMEEARTFIQELEGIAPNTLTGRFDGLVGKLNKLPSKEAKSIAAKALIDKVRSIGKEQEIARRPLYRVLQSFVLGR